METIRQKLMRQGYNLRERANIYAGAISGAILPVLLTRYSLFNQLDGSPLKETSAWIGSVILSIIPFAYTKHKAPVTASLVGFATGNLVGQMGACRLKTIREDEFKGRKRLENLTTL